MILVSGATGMCGKEIVLQLANLGISVKALVRDMAKATPFRGKCVHVTVGDLNEPATLEEAFKAVDRALLLPANSANQLDQERTFIDAAKRAGVEHVVKFSALGADDPHSGSRIIRWHAEAEDYLEASGMAWTHLRPTMFMQNLLGSAASIAGEGALYAPLGNTRVALVDVRDIAAVALKALTGSGYEGKAYTITGPEALTYGELAEKLAAVLGKPVRYVDVPTDQFKQSLLGAGMPDWAADALLEIFEYVAKPLGAEVTNVVAEIAKKAPITFNQFARDHAAAFIGNQ
jgi:uncharacterized protein YbjT (DUF2867 family)